MPAKAVDQPTDVSNVTPSSRESPLPKGMDALADGLNKDVKDLQTRVVGLTFPPEKVVGGAAALLEEVAATKISGEEDRYSHTDRYDFQGNIVELIVDALK